METHQILAKELTVFHSIPKMMMIQINKSKISKSDKNNLEDFSGHFEKVYNKNRGYVRRTITLIRQTWIIWDMNNAITWDKS